MKLTPEQIEQNGEALKASLRGEKVEVLEDGRWVLASCPFDSIRFMPMRPMPKPATRPWSKPDDVPGPVCWIRGIAVHGDSEMLVLWVDSLGIGAYGAPSHFWRFLKDCEYSTDRKAWHKCEVEV